MRLERYDPKLGPTPSSVVFDLLEAINHAHLLNARNRRKAVRLVKETALANDPKRVNMALELLGLDADEA